MIGKSLQGRNAKISYRVQIIVSLLNIVDDNQTKIHIENLYVWEAV